MSTIATLASTSPGSTHDVSCATINDALLHIIDAAADKFTVTDPTTSKTHHMELPSAKSSHNLRLIVRSGEIGDVDQFDSESKNNYVHRWSSLLRDHTQEVSTKFDMACIKDCPQGTRYKPSDSQIVDSSRIPENHTLVARSGPVTVTAIDPQDEEPGKFYIDIKIADDEPVPAGPKGYSSSDGDY
jgi:hypothetical protein